MRCRCGLNGILIDWFAGARGRPRLQHQIVALVQMDRRIQHLRCVRWAQHLSRICCANTSRALFLPDVFRSVFTCRCWQPACIVHIAYLHVPQR